ncbi:hypothetical protein [Methylorubrum extorquens]|jgi:hypothetical protein|uniref:Uncharacterized protein n=2 Tax=Methylorubrum extorquens TaxID=408 RepID=C5B4I3_METEA|nr:hypothetical protein [Methylorubrum extorquens]ACS43365.1 Hypothetical protein MexAM1_META2p0518 [Methylorubrum extorquens AM1]EHP91286.1 hypothetical protein MetexDRAFT_3841 [Methylorubrum extorquens DSM 13060]MCP1545540.1 hypothetical protein [Methylorubrum extorquens]MCP1591491.1 hypothetical protein [Methylorubrum extorquens]
MSGLLLGDKEMAHWFDTRPVFVRAAVTDDFREGTADYTALSERIATTRIEDAHKLVASEADLFRGMGRARRLRFLAWAAQRSTPDRPSAWARLFEKSDEGEEGSGANDVVDLFVDDIRAMQGPLAELTVRLIGDAENVRIVSRAAQDIVEAPAPAGGMP